MQSNHQVGAVLAQSPLAKSCIGERATIVTLLPFSARKSVVSAPVAYCPSTTTFCPSIFTLLERTSLAVTTFLFFTLDVGNERFGSGCYNDYIRINSNNSIFGNFGIQVNFDVIFLYFGSQILFNPLHFFLVGRYFGESQLTGTQRVALFIDGNFVTRSAATRAASIPPVRCRLP